LRFEKFNKIAIRQMKGLVDDGSEYLSIGSNDTSEEMLILKSKGDYNEKKSDGFKMLLILWIEYLINIV